MDYRYELQRTIDYIEDHIKDDIFVEDLATLISFSTKHYYHIFKINIGMSIMDYTRKRKLAHAINDIMLGKRIIDVSMDYGFETQSGFTKAFKKQYGSSPQNYKLHAICTLPIPINLLTQTTNYKICGGIIMEPKIMFRSAFKIAGYAIKTNQAKSTKDCPALWDKHNIEGWEVKLYDQLQPNHHGEYGVCVENNFETGEFVYVLGVAVNDFSKASDEMYRAEIPESEYAVFTTVPVSDAEFSKAIQNTWHYILQEWLPNSTYVWDESKPDFEFYDERCHNDNAQVMDIYIPLIKK